MRAANLVTAANFLLLAASFPVGAQAPAAQAQAPVAAAAPYRGSSISYGHTASALSASKSAEPFYDPYYVHALALQPKWHFGEHLYVQGRFELEQELTLGETTYPYEVVWSDLVLDVGSDGLQEPRTGIRVAGSLRMNLPLSKVSAAQTKLFSVGPGVSLSRRFPVRSGLSVRYAARYTQRFHRYTTVQYEAPTIAACGDVRDQSCAPFLHTGARNVRADFVQGPSVSFDPLAKLHLSASFQLSHGLLYALTPSGLPLQAEEDVAVRESTAFILGAGYDLTSELSVSLGVSTFTAQPGPDGLRRTPFFNRNTTFTLDAALDVESLLSRLR